MLARISLAALLVIAPTAARAQFAGVVAAPPRRVEAVVLTPAELSDQRDSVRQETLSDMRAWVDSAAGIVTVTPRAPSAPERAPTSAPDSVRTTPMPPPRPPRR